MRGEKAEMLRLAGRDAVSRAPTYTCAQCGGVFAFAWSDEEADAEYERDFPSYVAAGAPREVICDDCHQRFTKWRSTEKAPPTEDRS